MVYQRYFSLDGLEGISQMPSLIAKNFIEHMHQEVWRQNRICDVEWNNHRVTLYSVNWCVKWILYFADN